MWLPHFRLNAAYNQLRAPRYYSFTNLPDKFGFQSVGLAKQEIFQEIRPKLEINARSV